MKSTLSVLSLTVCASCATPTPFPFEKLEKGMTMTAVRQAVGDPKAIHEKETWTYVHEERNSWILPPSPLCIPALLSVIPLGISRGEPFAIYGPLKTDVVLRFKDEKLWRWILMDSDGGTRRPPGE